MLDIKLIREQTDFLKGELAKRGVEPAEVDRLLEVAVGRIWTRTEFRHERQQLGRMAAEYLNLARHLAGLPSLKLPSIWTWDAQPQLDPAP